MGEPGAIMITQRRQENLGLVFQSSECIGIHDTVPVQLKGGSNIARERFLVTSSGICTQGSEFRKKIFFPDLELFPDGTCGNMFYGRGDWFLPKLS